MNQALSHRGPDSDGMYVDVHVALGMRRLSIIDLAGGRQPIFNETGRIALVCNGEIYNYVELRQELARRGHRFRTQSDVETIVHLYEDHGEGFLQPLRGMFACALWDADRQRLILARDRIGEKPLYLFQDQDGRVWFASEMKSLKVGLAGTPLEISPEAVNLFLTYQYVPEPHTMLEGITKLPAGHLLELGGKHLSITSKPYWDYLAVPAREGNPVQLVRQELERACEIMGRADVPVGVALSGGIDSSAIAALAARTYPGTLEAFSVGYSGRPQTDERSNAAALARQLGIPFHDIELATDDFARLFPALVWAMDDPIGDIATYGYYAVSQAARRKNVPVLLSGLGGDELFWGYSWVCDAIHRTERKKRLRNLPAWLRRIIGRNVEGAPGRMVFYDLHPEIAQGDALSRSLLTPEAAERVEPGLWMSYFESTEWDQIPLRLSRILNQTWLQSNCLALADRTSMAHSIEMRLPLLDVGLIELVTGLRANGLDDWKRSHKWLLIEAVKDVVPAEVLSRNKQGFTPPVFDWYQAVISRYGPLLVNGSLTQRGIFNNQVVATCLTNAPISFRYKMVLLEIWSRLFADGMTADELLEASPPTKHCNPAGKNT